MLGCRAFDASCRICQVHRLRMNKDKAEEMKHQAADWKDALGSGNPCFFCTLHTFFWFCDKHKRSETQQDAQQETKL